MQCATKVDKSNKCCTSLKERMPVGEEVLYDLEETGGKSGWLFRHRLLICGHGLIDCLVLALIYPRVEPRLFGCRLRAAGLQQSPGLEFLSATEVPAAKTGYPRT